MTVFADASALVAIIAQESDALVLADCLERDRSRLYSAIAAWETVAGLTHVYRLSVENARERVMMFLEALDFHLVPIGARELGLAMGAYARFGNGRHPARLNMGDCFAYACAQANDAELQFKGGDFSKTDIVSARHP